MPDLSKEFAPILDDAKKIGKDALKDGVELGRKTIAQILNGFGKTLSSAEKQKVIELYNEAEDHAVAGRVSVAVAMAARLDNYLASRALVGESEAIRAGREFLKNALGMLMNIAKSVLSLVGGPVVAKVADLAVDSIDNMMGGKPAAPANKPAAPANTPPSA